MTIAVESFMTRNPRCIDASTPISEAYRLMGQLDVRHLPVLLDGRLAGVVSQTDLLRLEASLNISRSNALVSSRFIGAPCTPWQSGWRATARPVPRAPQDLRALRKGCVRAAGAGAPPEGARRWNDTCSDVTCGPSPTPASRRSI